MIGNNGFLDYLYEKLAERSNALESSKKIFDKDKRARLLCSISNTNQKVEIDSAKPEYDVDIVSYIKQCPFEEVGFYSKEFGDTPLTLAIMKGYNHQAPHYSINLWGSKVVKMRDTIEAILDRKDVDMIINKPCILGLTPLEISILRHDDLKLMEKLIQKGAQIPKNEHLSELLFMQYDEVVHILSRMCCGEYEKWKKSGKQFHINPDCEPYDKADAFFTLSEKDFKERKAKILEFFGKLKAKESIKNLNTNNNLTKTNSHSNG